MINLLRRRSLRSFLRLRPGILPWLPGGNHLILTFHRIRPVSERRNEFDTCPNHRVDHFRLILENIQSRFQIVPMTELQQLWREKNRLAAITFDDGWRDTFDLAAPVLSSMGITATVFITTDKIGSHRPFWQQILGHAFRLASESSEGVVAKKLRSTFGFSADTPFTPKTYKRTVKRIKQNYEQNTDEIIQRQFGSFAADSRNGRLFMNEGEIAKLATDGFEIGSHTTSHPLLTKVDQKQLTNELIESKKRLENITGRVIDAIAYPNGSYDRNVLDCARESGYRIGCTTRNSGLKAGHDLLELPRVEPCWEMSEDQVPRGTSGKTRASLNEPIALANQDSFVAQGKHDPPMAVNTHSADRKLRLLFVIDQFFDVMGGTEQHLLFLCRNMPDNDTHVQFAALTRICRCDKNTFGVPVQILFPASRIYGIGFWRRVWRLSRLIVRDSIDVVQPFCPISELAAVLAVRLARRGKVVGCRRNTGYWHTSSTIWRSRFAGRLTDHLVANCEAAKEFSLIHEWIPEGRISVIRNPVDLERLRIGEADPFSRERLGIHENEYVVAMVASVRPIKDQGTFIRAAQMVLEQCPQTRFLIVGHALPEYEKQLKLLSDSLQITQKVIWTGPVDNPYQLLSLVNVGVLCSLSEGFSNALMEYAAAGVPTVATNVGGTPEIIIDKETGFLIQPQSPEQLASRILHLLQNPTMASAMGLAAKKRILEINDPAFVIGCYASIYRLVRQRHITKLDSVKV